MARGDVCRRKGDAGAGSFGTFASTWSPQQDTVLAKLVAQLADMEIAPLGALDRIPSLIECRA